MNGGVALFNEVGTDNAKIVIRNMGESWTTFYITKGVNIRDVSLQFFVGLNKAVRIHLYTRRGKVQPVRIWCASSSHQQVRACECTFSLRCLDGQPNLTLACPFNLYSCRFQQDLYTVLAQDPGYLFCFISIFASQQILASLDNSHLATEATKHLPKFQTHIATSHDQQMLWYNIKFHDRGRIQRRYAIYTAYF